MFRRARSDAFFYLGKLIEFRADGKNLQTPAKTGRRLHHRSLRLIVIPSGVENGATGQPRHRRKDRSLSEREVSELITESSHDSAFALYAKFSPTRSSNLGLSGLGGDSNIVIVTPVVLPKENPSGIRPKIWVFLLKGPKIGSNSR